MHIREWFSRLIGSAGSTRRDREAEEEMRFHFEAAVEAAMARGATREEALRQVRLRLGSPPAALDSVRDQRGLPWLSGARLDLKHAVSALRRQPGFLFTATGALAASVAVNTIIFALAYGVAFRPLPYPDPERLVRLFEWSPGNPKFPVSIRNYLEDRRESRTLASLGLYTREDVQLMHGERPERLPAMRVTDDSFPTLGVAPALGRNFFEAELKQKARVAILSHTFWKTRLHADPDIVGKMLRLDRETWTIVGVLPNGFQHVGGDYRSTLQGDTVALWTPLGLDGGDEENRYAHFTNAIARLKPGISAAAARDDLNRILDDLARRYPDAYAGRRAVVSPLATEMLGRSRATIRLLILSGASVLLVAYLNIAGLCVARVLARRRELAVRQALGGGRWQIVRSVLSENVLIGAAGGALGIALAAAGVPALHALLPADFPRSHEIRFDWVAAAFALAIALLTALAAGLVPALREHTGGPAAALAQTDRMAGAAAGVRTLRGALLAGEVALACVLCFGALLLVRSAHRLAARDHGFDTAGVLTFGLTLPEQAYRDRADVAAFAAEAVRRWSALPGVQAVGLATNLPWTGYDENTGFEIVGRPAQPGESVQARFQGATPGFFEALRFRLRAGRFIAPSDTSAAAPVVVVNEALARRYLGANPVTRYMDVWGAKRRIVGVVADVRDHPADVAAEPAFWMPVAQVPFRSLRAAVRTDGDPTALAAPLRAALQQLDPELPMAEVQPMTDVAAVALAERRFVMSLVQAFAWLAVSLAGIGVYGMLAYTVQQRRKEIGIRLTLGATRSSLVRLVMTNGITLAAAGAIVAIALSPAAGHVLSSMLYGVTPTDTAVLIAAPAILLAVSLAGSALPAWTAARSQPVSTLREQ